MKIVVIGGSGLIGKKTVAILREQGHEVVAASPSHGVDTISGKGLSEALQGAEVVVDVANSPSFEDNGSDGLLPDLRKKPGRRRKGGRGSASRRPIGRRHRSHAREWLLPCEVGPRRTDQSFDDSLLHRPGNAVLRVRRRHCRIRSRWPNRSTTTGQNAAHLFRRCCRGSRRRCPSRTAERNDRPRRTGTDRHGRPRTKVSRRPQGSAPGGHRPRGRLLRHRRKRWTARAGG